MRPVLFHYYFSARLGRKSRRNTWKAWPRPMFTALKRLLARSLVQDVQASCLPHRSYVSNKAFRELLLSKLYHKNVVCVWLTRLTVILIGKFIIFIPNCEMFCDLKSIGRFAALLSFLLPLISFFVLLSCILQRNDKHLE